MNGSRCTVLIKRRRVSVVRSSLGPAAIATYRAAPNGLFAAGLELSHDAYWT
jgi:hypothetical protein